MNRILKLVKNKYSWIILAVIISVCLYVFVFKNNTSSLETVEVRLQTFEQQVSVAGKVIPAENVDLGFETTGKVSAVYKNVGDKVSAGQVLVVLSGSDVGADILKAEADLAAEQAKLNQLNSGTPGVSGSELSTRNRELSQTIQDAYTKADDAIRNKANQVFYSDNSSSQGIVFAFSDYDLKNKINKERSDVDSMMDKWKKNITLMGDNFVTDTDISLAETNLTITKNFLSDVALAVNDFQTTGSDFTQSEINGFKESISQARTSINDTIANLTSAKDAVRSVKSDIPYQEAKVKAAQAAVNSLNAELSKKTVVAPFSGVITKQDAKIGAIVSANTPVVTLISDKQYQVETFVPEINIKDIKSNDTAKITLDAYGADVVFPAKVISIDPAETIRDGVSSYKVKFEFVVDDDRIRSGMTANVDITTQIKNDSILIPQSAVVRKNGFSYVTVRVGNVFVEKQVTTGGVSLSGDIEIVAGLDRGELVVISPDKLPKK